MKELVCGPIPVILIDEASGLTNQIVASEKVKRFANKIVQKRKPIVSSRPLQAAASALKQEHTMVSTCYKKQMSANLTWFLILVETLILYLSLISLVSSHHIYRAKMVRLCIASVDPAKLSSQCVMCNREEFPHTVMDCTGIQKMNDLIASPLSVQEATCLIYNCRRQVPDIKPEPYHGTAAVRANYPSASGIRSYEMIAPPDISYGAGGSSGSFLGSHSTSRYATYGPAYGALPYSSSSNIMTGRQAALPYAIMPATYGSSFGNRRYKAAIVPLFR